MKMGKTSQAALLFTFCLILASTQATASDLPPGTQSQSLSGFFKHIFGSKNQSAPEDSTEENDSEAAAENVTQNTFAGAEVQKVQFQVPNAPAQFSSCSEMQVGESRFIDPTTLPITIGIPYPGPGYLLKRGQDSSDGKSNYEAAVNIQFVPKAGEAQSLVPPMLKLVSECYANLPLIEDSEGHRLNVRLVKPGEVAPVRKISLTGIKLPREDMLSWSTQSNCRTIAHETFHLLGLVDLYPETSLKTGTGETFYNCRNLGPTDSVMRDLHNSHFASSRYMKHSCACASVACDRTDTQCLKRNSQCPKDLAAISSAPTACPSTSEAAEFPILVDTYDMATNSSDQAFFDTNYAPLLKAGNHTGKYNLVFLSLEADVKPLLYPGELRMLLHPGCLAQNEVYYQCAKSAYLTSSATQACPAKPSLCNDPKLWLQ